MTLARMRVIAIGAVFVLSAFSACSPPGDPRQSLYDTKGGFRLLRDSDFCSGVALFAARERESMIGTVLTGARRYAASPGGAEFRAVRVLTMVKGERGDRWYRRDALVGHVYVLTEDQHFGNCDFWLEEEQPISPSEREIPAR